MLLTAATPNASPSFETFLLTLIQGPDPRATREYSLDHGVDEPALLRYASGAVSVYERSEIEGVISKCEWARTFIVRHVKQQRLKTKVAA